MNTRVRKRRMTVTLWRISAVAFVLGLIGLASIAIAGERAPSSKVGLAASVLVFAAICVMFLAGAALSVIHLRNLIARFRAGERFSDHDPWNRD